jgi:hypothetical protein
MKKCPNTISGNHLWEMRTWANNDVKNNIFWNITIPRCVLCNLHDDRKIKLPKNKPMKIKYEKP